MMEKVQIYLKTAIFTRNSIDESRRITPIRSQTSNETDEVPVDPIPAKTMILDATIQDSHSSGFLVVAHKYYSIRHEELSGEQTKLFLPTSKIDHIRILD